MNISSKETLADSQPITTTLDAERVTEALKIALLDIHLRNSKGPIDFPSAKGAFPDAFLVSPMPVVPDANRLRDDVLYACRHRQRTVLVNAANARILRLFCAQHVVDEVFEHIEEWTEGSDVSPATFRRRWLSEYLPVVRVVPSEHITASLLSPQETARIDELVPIDPDDVPSVTLALVLEAFYLSNDKPALRAVYGCDADLTAHDEWLRTLMAGGDAGELGRMFNLLIAISFLIGSGLTAGIRRLVAAIGPWSLIPLALSIVAIKYISSDARQRAKSATIAIGKVLFHAFGAYHDVLMRFQQATPPVATWEQLATTNHKNAVVLRACLHTLARSGMSNRSARELAQELPFLGVPQGEAKLRQVLRTHSSFFEVSRGRWQLGEVAPLLKSHVD
jgi:predicted nucleic acid-binding protein